MCLPGSVYMSVLSGFHAGADWFPASGCFGADVMFCTAAVQEKKNSQNFFARSMAPNLS